MSEAPSPQFIDLLEESARLNALELEAAEKVVASGTGGAAWVGEPKLASKLVPIYRFFNTATNAHFFTASTEERDHIRANLPIFQFEGIAFYANLAPARGLSPVYRFYNTQTGVHLFTISESEKTNIQKNIPQFLYEGIAYYASQVTAAGTSSIRRFLVRDKGFHFYTSSAEEAARIRATLPNYIDEGPAYFALTSTWTQPVDVDLTIGSWVLTARDSANSSWTGSTLVFSQQAVSGENNTFHARVNFVRNGQPYGAEDFTGTLYASGRMEMSGYSVTPGYNLITANWRALLNVAGNQFLDGTWSRPDGRVISGNWTAVR
ncbi:hypothetical protein [Hydrogenophaga crassostreae]|nr:hypothetical protein [Hydrogenophaga crassostreae]